MGLRILLLCVLVALAGAAAAVPAALAAAPSEAKLEVNENCVENGWPCWAAPGSGSKPPPASRLTIAVGGEVMFTDARSVKVNIAWLGTPPACTSGVPVSPTPPQSGWEGTCKFEEAGTYRFESSTLFDSGGENFTKYEIVVGETAPAGGPEFGRCLKVAREMVGRKTVYHGGYSDSGCTKASPETKGKFEWYPGVAKTHFTTATKRGMKVLFETVKGMKVTCNGETSSGEYTGPKLEENVVFRFTGCDFIEGSGSHKTSYPASSAGAPEGEIVSNPTECELGVVKNGATSAKNKIALTCAEEDEFMWIKWKVPGYNGSEAELCLRGWWFFTLKANSMSMSTTLGSKQAHGQQEWEKFEDGPPEPLESTLNGGPFEHAGLMDTTVQTNEEPVEVNSVV
jgi:hypothetical protein